MEKQNRIAETSADNSTADENKSIDFVETFNKAFFLINSRMLKERTENYFECFLQDDRYHYKGLFTFMAKQKSHYSKAVSMFTSLIQSGHRVKEVFLYRGIALALLDEYEESVADFQTAMEIDPRYVAAYHAMGALKLRNGFIFESPEWFIKSTEMDPEFHTAWFNLGKNSLELGKCSQALEYFDRAIELYSKESSFYHFKGLALCRLLKFKDAIAEFTKAILLQPTFAEAYKMRAEASNHLGWYREYIDDKVRFQLIKEKSSYAWLFQADAFFEAGRYHDAIQSYNQYYKSGDNLSVCYSGLGDCFFMQKNYDQAIYYYRKAIEISRKFSWAWYNLGLCLYLKNQSQEAAEAFFTYILLRPDSVDGFLNLSACFFMRCEFDLTISFAKMALDIVDCDHGACNNIALAYCGKENLSASIEWLNKAIELDESDLYYFNRAVIYFMFGEHDLMNAEIAMYTKLTGILITEKDLEEQGLYCAYGQIKHYNAAWVLNRKFRTDENADDGE